MVDYFIKTKPQYNRKAIMIHDDLPLIDLHRNIEGKERFYDSRPGQAASTAPTGL